MSDGNFNRALLPHTPYASGLKMGRATTLAKAEQAFKLWLRTYTPDISDEALSCELDKFKALLR